MAIPGLYEVTQTLFCAKCMKTHSVQARSKEWTGDIRTDLLCGTAGCGNVFQSDRTHKSRTNKGNVSIRPEIALLTLPGPLAVVIEDYDCSEGEAQEFASMFNSVLSRIPDTARDTLIAHWLGGCGSPHVWLLEDRREWGGGGWAASDRRGFSLYFMSALIRRLPNEHASTAIAHEFAHMIFIAGGEPHHCSPRDALAGLIGPDSIDPLHKVRPEWLVWRLLESWGFDQLAMEGWMERNVVDNLRGFQFRDQPIADADCEGRYLLNRREFESKLSDMVFPAPFEKYLKA